MQVLQKIANKLCMVTQILNPDLISAKEIKAPVAGSSGLVPGAIAPLIKIGQVFPVTVRENSAQGEGQIFIKGLLLPASIPKELLAGSQLLVELTSFDETQLVFRLVSAKDLAPDAVGKLLRDLTSEISKLAEPGSGLLMHGKTPLLLPALSSSTEAGLPSSLSGTTSKEILQLATSLEQLFDSQTILDNLQAAGDGTLAKTFRDIAQKLTDTLVQLSKEEPTAAARSLTTLRQELASLIPLIRTSDPHLTESAIKSLADRLGQALFQQTALVGKNERAIKGVFSELSTVQPNHPQAEQLLTNLLSMMDDLLNSAGGSRSAHIDGLQIADIKQAVTKLEQLANAQETLAKLNPIMQALGEPALILFPFAFQGLISHSEIVIDPDQSKRGGENDSEDSSRNTEQAKYHRVSMNVPLPNLGNVFVDVAHRIVPDNNADSPSQEVLVSLTVEDQERAAFLVEQLEQLLSVLRENGFTKAELSTRVGTIPDVIPAWVESLSHQTSIKA